MILSASVVPGLNCRDTGKRGWRRTFAPTPASGLIFGAYDNLIARWPVFGRVLRAILQPLERTPLRAFGLSHFWVVEKTA